MLNVSSRARSLSLSRHTQTQTANIVARRSDERAGDALFVRVMFRYIVTLGFYNVCIYIYICVCVCVFCFQDAESESAVQEAIDQLLQQRRCTVLR